MTATTKSDAAVAASSDAPDHSSPDAAMHVWSQAERERYALVLKALKSDDCWRKKNDKSSQRMRARSIARTDEIAIREQLRPDHSDLIWNPRRALVLTDFDYLFLHRERIGGDIQDWLEIINAKIKHVKDDGEDGYFNKLERNVGWTQYITPIIFCDSEIIDIVVRCGLWLNAKNSRRCHKPDFCSNCLWNDVLYALAFAYGPDSGAFGKAPAWFLVTIGWTTNPANAKCQFGDYAPDDFEPPVGDRGYDPYPVILGFDDYDADCAWLGYEDARTLGIIAQKAISELYEREIIGGYHNRLEGEYRLNPGGANRVNLHAHAVVNSADSNGEFLAEKIHEFVHTYWTQFGFDQLNQKYYPDIHVRRITNPEHLYRAVVYTEKVVPINHAVADALSRPEALDANGYYNPKYIAGLKVALARLIDDDIPALFTKARLNDDLPCLFRRRTVGNMQFTDDGTCLGTEPERHQIKRHKARESARECRARKKEREAEQAAQSGAGIEVKPLNVRLKPAQRQTGSSAVK